MANALVVTDGRAAAAPLSGWTRQFGLEPLQVGSLHEARLALASRTISAHQIVNLGGSIGITAAREKARARILAPGTAVVVSANVRHSIRARTDCTYLMVVARQPTSASMRARRAREPLSLVRGRGRRPPGGRRRARESARWEWAGGTV
jgi:hypothetical protein